MYYKNDKSLLINSINIKPASQQKISFLLINPETSHQQYVAIISFGAS